MRWANYDTDYEYEQPDTLADLCECYAKNYHRRVDPSLSQFVDENEFAREFRRSVISLNLRYSHEFANEAELIYSKLLCVSIN